MEQCEYAIRRTACHVDHGCDGYNGRCPFYMTQSHLEDFAEMFHEESPEPRLQIIGESTGLERFYRRYPNWGN